LRTWPPGFSSMKDVTAYIVGHIRAYQPRFGHRRDNALLLQADSR
jgi:hypothetical protein